MTGGPAADRALTGHASALCDFCRRSPTAFHAVAGAVSLLEGCGFVRVDESGRFEVEPGGSYYVVRNDSSLVAFRVGESVERASFSIALAHLDSPTFRLKPNFELEGPEGYLRLDVEAYGGTIDRSWLDRPLTVAGRLMVEHAGRIESRLVAPDRDLALIPSVAVHLERDVNEKGAIDRAHDIYPVVSASAMAPGDFAALLAREAGTVSEHVLSHDLFLVNRQESVVWGGASEFVSSPRLDDLQCAYAALQAIMGARNERSVEMVALLDSEEVGSSTMQGAQSTFVSSVLERICAAVSPGREHYLRALANSFVVSCDNAHALHPNHPELSDAQNVPRLNEGVVVKVAARQTYATDAFSAAVFETVCRRADVPTQRFANRSDMPGGSTMGNLLLRGTGVHTVDIGCAQLAMHSAYETAGSLDTDYLIRALTSFFEGRISYRSDGFVSVSWDGARWGRNVS